MRVLPAHLLPLVLLVQPLLQRSEVFQKSAGISLTLTSQCLQGIGPRLALTHLKHLVEFSSRLFRPIKSALMQRTLVSGLAAERAVKLELQNVCQKITRVGRIRSDVIFRCGIKV